MNNFEKTIFGLSVLSIIIIILILPLRMFVFDSSYYDSQFQKNNVYNSINKSLATDIKENLLNFLQEGDALNYFSEEEKSHLNDVRVLFSKFFFVLWAGIGLLIISSGILIFRKKFKENVFKILFLGGLCSFVLIILLFLASLNFEMTFGNFHKMFFPQGNYSFADTSLLITLFPANFFNAFFLKLLVSSFTLSLLSMVPQLWINKRNNLKK
mgnify:CR=1 FL=1